MTLQPLMQRVQAALKDQLTRQNEKLEIDLREQVHMHTYMHNFYVCVIHVHVYVYVP